MGKKLAIGALLVFALSALAAAWIWTPWLFTASYTIRIATGPIGSEGQKFIAAFRREVQEEHPRIRLALEETPSLQASADALQADKVDLAAARSDHPAAAAGGTIVVLRRIPLVIMVPANSAIRSMAALAGKKIAVLEGTAADDPLLVAVTEFYGLEAADLVSTSLAALGPALRDKRAVAVIATGAGGQLAIGDAVKAMVKATNKAPRFIDLDAEAIAAQHPLYEAVIIAPGTFLATAPGEELATLAVAVRLVARNGMLDEVAGEITRLLLATRAKLAASAPLAAQIEAPDTDKKGVLPVHPGAAAYLDGTRESFFEQAMSLLFNASNIGGVLGSFALWLNGFWRKHGPDEIRKNLARLPAMLREVKAIPVDQLGAIEEELDNLSGWLLERFLYEKIAPDRISGIAVIIAQIRLIIERRRKLSSA